MGHVENAGRYRLFSVWQERLIGAGIPGHSRRLALLAWTLQWLVPLLWLVTAYLATVIGSPDLDGGPQNSIDLQPISKVTWIVLSSIAPIFLGIAFRKLYLLLRTFGEGQFFTDDTVEAMKGIGRYILLYSVFWQLDVLAIGAVLYHTENLNSFPWVFNVNLEAFAAGAAVLLLAGVINEGRRIQEELRFVV